MPHVDFPNVPDDDFEPVPDGEYRCRCTDVDVGESSEGNEMWTLTWTIEGGEYDGKRIRDRLVFVDTALPRIKLVCNRLGIDTSGPLNLASWMLEGRLADVRTYIKGYKTKEGEERKGNTVPYSGYEYVDQPAPIDATELEASGATGGHRPVTDEDIPFTVMLAILAGFMASLL